MIVEDLRWIKLLWDLLEVYILVSKSNSFYSNFFYRENRYIDQQLSQKKDNQ